MADKKISALTGATTPLAGTEVLPIVQSGTTVKVAVSNLTAGRAVATGALTASGNVRVEYSAAGNVSSIVNNTANTAAATSQFIATNDASRNLRIQYTSSGGAGGAALTNGISTETGQIYTDGNYPLVLGTNVSAAAIIDTSQNVRLINNLIIGTSGKGIDFSATSQAAGMTSELLADYEEGTWTPVVTSSTGTITTVGAVTGTYTKVGRQVTVWASIAITNNGTGGGFLAVAGLPFTASNLRQPGVSWNENSAITGIAYINPNFTTVAIWKYDGGYPVVTGQSIVFTISYNV